MTLGGRAASYSYTIEKAKAHLQVFVGGGEVHK